MHAGVDLGGTKIQVAILDRKHKVLGTNRRLTPTKGTPDDVANAIFESIKEAAVDAGISIKEIAAVGVGSPGQIEIQKGTVSNAGNLPGWKTATYALGPQLSKRLGGIPVSLGNDVQVAVDAEVHLGAGRPYRSLLGVFCGTGVGGGLAFYDELWVGRGAAGEIGHTVVDATSTGAQCSCGRTGCMEAYSGRAALEAEARKRHKKGKKTKLFKIMEEKGKTRLASGVWDKALRKNDKLATTLIDRAVWALGNGIGSAINLTDVDVIIIGGGLGIRLGQPFADRIAESMNPRLIKPNDAPPVLVAELGDLGGAIGASLLVSHLDTLASQATPGASGKHKTVKKPVVSKATSKRATVARKAPAKKAAAKKSPAKKSAVKKTVKRTPAKATPTKAAAKKAPAKKAPAKKAPAKKSAVKKVTKKTSTKKR